MYRRIRTCLVLLSLSLLTTIVVGWWLALRDARISTLAWAEGINIAFDHEYPQFLHMNMRNTGRPHCSTVACTAAPPRLSTIHALLLARARQNIALSQPRGPIANLPGLAMDYPSWLGIPSAELGDLTEWGARTSGWPHPAMRSRFYTPAGGVQETRWTLRVFPASWYSSPGSGLEPRVGTIPLEPIWPGFFLNTVLAGVAWSALYGLIRMPALLARRSENRCPHCQYSRAGLPLGAPCPECGGSIDPT